MTQDAIPLGTLSVPDPDDAYENSDSEIEVFPPKKRFRYRVLNFIRSYYMLLLRVCSALIILMLLVVILLACLYFLKPDVDEVQARFQALEINYAIAKTSLERHLAENSLQITKSKALNSSLAEERIVYERSEKVLNDKIFSLMGKSEQLSSKLKALMHDHQRLKDPFIGIACKAINCAKVATPCNIQNVSYINIKRYSCCGCLRVANYADIRLLRYENFQFAKYSAIVLNDFVSACNEPLLLNVLPQLPCLLGTWDIVRTSDSTCNLYYSIVGSTCVEAEEQSVVTPHDTLGDPQY